LRYHFGELSHTLVLDAKIDVHGNTPGHVEHAGDSRAPNEVIVKSRRHSKVTADVMLSIINPLGLEILVTSFISFSEVLPDRGRPEAVLLFAGVFSQPELTNRIVYRISYRPLAFLSDSFVDSDLGSLLSLLPLLHGTVRKP
jgi:hypothetical protein